MKTKKNLRSNALSAVEKIARNEIRHAFGWPPECAGIYHQPKRPTQQKRT